MRKIGALWKKESKKDGKKFLSGNVEFVAGVKVNILVVQNDKSKAKNDKAPDYNVCLSDPYVPKPLNVDVDDL